MEKIQQTYLANLRKMMAEQDIHPVISSRLPNSSKAPASR